MSSVVGDLVFSGAVHEPAQLAAERLVDLRLIVVPSKVDDGVSLHDVAKLQVRVQRRGLEVGDPRRQACGRGTDTGE